jgi:hypothetical protein
VIELSNLKKYASYFHDGDLLEINNMGSDYVLTLESGEMDPEDLEDPLVLSVRDTLKGKLHLEKVKRITVRNEPLSQVLKLPYDYGTIFSLKFIDHTVELKISWRNVPGKEKVNDFSVINLECGNICWENLPDMPDLFW